MKRWKIESNCSINNNVDRGRTVLALTVIGSSRGRRYRRQLAALLPTESNPLGYSSVSGDLPE